MLLTGSFERTVDERNRIAVPKRMRELLLAQSAAIYLAPGTDGSLSLYSETAFTHVAEQLANASPTAQDVRSFSRLFYAQAERMEIDKQGRVRISAELAQFAALDKEVMLIGVGDHLEIWNKQRWQQYLAQKQASYDELAEGAFTRGSTHAPPNPATTKELAPAPTRPTHPR